LKDIKFIYFEGCPNAGKVRKLLQKAGVDFSEILQDDLSPEHPLKNYSSPTILKGEKIILGSEITGQGGGCSLNIISIDRLKSLLNIKDVETHKRKKGIMAIIGSMGSAITVGLCPLCIPAIGAFLSSVGLGFLVQEAVLKPLLITLLLLAWSGFYWSYRKEHGNIYPFLSGLFFGVSLYLGRYVYIGLTINQFLMYGGIAGLVLVSIWNLIIRKKRS